MILRLWSCGQTSRESWTASSTANAAPPPMTARRPDPFQIGRACGPRGRKRKRAPTKSAAPTSDVRYGMTA
jgi:hypothetical protein